MKIQKLIGFVVLTFLVSTTHAAVNFVITWEHDFANQYIVYRLDDINGTKTLPGVTGKYVVFAETPLTDGTIAAAKSVTVRDVQPGTYSIRVLPWSATAGDGIPSDLVTATVPPKPAKPGNVQIRVAAESPATITPANQSLKVGTSVAK